MTTSTVIILGIIITAIFAGKKASEETEYNKKESEYIFNNLIKVKEFLKENYSQVVSIIDGDTIDIIHKNEKLRLRLYGIDCPEKGNVLHNEIVAFLEDKLLNKSVKVEFVNTDKYGRDVAIVYIGNVSINEMLVKQGYAFVYHQFCVKDDYYKQLVAQEQFAKNLNIGIWYYGFLQPWLVRKNNDDPNAVMNTLNSFSDNLGY